MRPPRRSRSLSGEDARLWSAIARLITPLKGRAALRGEAPPSIADPKPAVAVRPLPDPMIKLPPKPPAKRVVLKPTPLPSPPAPILKPAPPPAPGLERRTRLALRRGALQVDARIDLHGMYQAQAHNALVGFLMRAQASGHTLILVVTGKGGDNRDLAYDDAFSERGVLRRSVPHWLRAPELRGVVLGFEEAARHHGGAGALYVRLKRR